jgi:hypothetical protein
MMQSKQRLEECLDKAIQKIQESLDEAKNQDEVVSLGKCLSELLDKMPKSSKREELWDVKRTAEYLHLKEGTIKNWISMKKISHKKIGGKVVFDPKEVRQFVQNNSVEADPVWRPRRRAC